MKYYEIRGFVNSWDEISTPDSYTILAVLPCDVYTDFVTDILDVMYKYFQRYSEDFAKLQLWYSDYVGGPAELKIEFIDFDVFPE